MIRLLSNGINGILADEMGLGNAHRLRRPLLLISSPALSFSCSGTTDCNAYTYIVCPVTMRAPCFVTVSAIVTVTVMHS